MTLSGKSQWNRYILISVCLHALLLSIPITMVVRHGQSPIEVSLVDQKEPVPRPQARTVTPPAKKERPRPLRAPEKPLPAMRPEEARDVKAQIVSPGEKTVMQVAPGTGDAATGVAIAGAKVGSSGTALGGSMPGGSGTGAGYGYGGEGKGTMEGQFGRGDGPSFAHREMPEYPFAAKRLGKEGRVVLQVTIDARGRLEDVQVVEASDQMFVDPAVDSIKKSRFNPGRKNGVPHRYRCKLAIRFSLGT